MSKTVLITGGAGFIGSHLADHLLQAGYAVRALDSLSAPNHDSGSGRPSYLDPAIELRVGDIRDPNAVRNALRGMDAVVHLAAAGPGTRRGGLVECTSTNLEGTARLLEALMRQPVERLVVASNMNVYGEGLYQETSGRILPGEPRSADQLESRTWDLWTRQGDILLPIPTPESKPPDAASVDALSKFTQERMCLLTSRACDIPTVALRLFNVYGTRLALSGGRRCVLAEFASRLLLDRSPMIFEDGYQQRDFVSVHDVASACRLALETPKAVGHVLNIGSGCHFTIRELAVRLANVLGKQHIELKITQKHRFGDVRHCFADIRLARELLGFEPRVTLDEGLAELGEWLAGQNLESHPAAVPDAEMRAGTV